MKVKSVCLGVAVFLVLGFILLMSRQTAMRSNGLSMQLSSIVHRVAVKVVPEDRLNLRALNRKIREYAHFVSYMVLAVVLYHALAHFGVKSPALWAVAICFGLGIVDEYLQTFVEGRGGEIKDVLMDGIGAMTGVALSVARRVIRGGKNGFRAEVDGL